MVNKLIEKTNKMRVKNEIWIATGLRTPFAKAEKELKNISALDMSKEVLNKMVEKAKAKPDLGNLGNQSYQH